jgi:hypothetical protein
MAGEDPENPGKQFGQFEDELSESLDNPKIYYGIAPKCYLISDGEKIKMRFKGISPHKTKFLGTDLSSSELPNPENTHEAREIFSEEKEIDKVHMFEALYQGKEVFVYCSQLQKEKTLNLRQRFLVKRLTSGGGL